MNLSFPQGEGPDRISKAKERWFIGIDGPCMSSSGLPETMLRQMVTATLKIPSEHGVSSDALAPRPWWRPRDTAPELDIQASN